MELVSISIGLDADCRAAIAKSLSDLSILVAGLDADRLSDAVAHLGVTGNDLGDLLGPEAVETLTGGASELQGLKIKPGNGYLKLFSALADDANTHRVRVRHGWPVLSSESPTPTLTGDARGVE